MRSDSEPWRTLESRSVLAVARTLTSAIRLLELLAPFRDDFALKLVHTVDPSSAFSDGAAELLVNAGAKVVPWRDIDDLEYDLAISTSENIDFSRIKTRTLVLPHGVAFHKYVPDSRTGDTRLSGLVPTPALRTGRVLMAISHPDHDRQLREHSSAAAGNTVLVGDPGHDQLLASVGHRDHYRRLLGVAPERRLVLVSSTWRDQSLLARHPLLAVRMLAELPCDDYAVALVLHPNIWSSYRELQITSWFAAAREAGLLIIPPDRGWQAAVIATDVLVGDHGSVTFMGAVLGRPVLLAAVGAETVPGTSMAALGERAGRLHVDQPLRTQLAAAIDTHDPTWQRQLAADTFANSGHAATALRDVVYELLSLAPPGEPVPVYRVADPDVTPRPVTAYTVHAEHVDSDTLALRRYPRSVHRWRRVGGEPNDLQHLVVDEQERDTVLPDNASVVTRRVVLPDAEQWCAAALHRHPGSSLAVAATDQGCVAVLRTGTTLTVQAAEPVDPMALASVAYVSWRTDRMTEHTCTLRLGAHTTEVTVS